MHAVGPRVAQEQSFHLDPANWVLIRQAFIGLDLAALVCSVCAWLLLLTPRARREEENEGGCASPPTL